MSSEYWEIVGFKKTRNDKVIGIRLGTAKQREDGGFYLNFDALPYGDMSVSVCPPREKKPQRAESSDPNDSIPF
jgi:hypothetical protein